ncbi:MAG: hypothetical protein KAG66_06740, partial [Methylococcales bacterium]|nr:hypothetical protein [Methylococcales bacterium]
YVENIASPTIDFTTEEDTGDGYYTISSQDGGGTEMLTSNSYTLYARPTTRSNQNRDSACTEFSLDNVGRKRASGYDNDNCW